MLGWIISLVMLASGVVNNNPVLVVTSGLFGIAGSIAWAAYTLIGNKNNNAPKQKSENSDNA